MISPVRIAFLVSALGILCVFGGCCKSQLEVSTDLRNHEPLAVFAQKAQEAVLYEGLPHHINEKKLVEEEVQLKDTVRMHGFLFYAKSIELKAEDAKKLTTLFSDPASFAFWAIPSYVRMPIRLAESADYC